MTYPQPYEGVKGTDRSEDYLLSLDPKALSVRAVIMALAKHLGDATLVGNPAPRVARMRERMTAPQIGDLVVEESKALHSRDEIVKAQGFGILLAVRDEWCVRDEDWEKEKTEYDLRDEDRAHDRGWYVQYGCDPGDVCRWTDCSFMVVPTFEDFTLSVGTRSETGVTLTRDDLLSSLGDAGFDLVKRS